MSYIFGDMFKERARVVTFDCGNDIFEEGDEPKGIYIIISGMIKVSQIYSKMHLWTLVKNLIKLRIHSFPC